MVRVLLILGNLVDIVDEVLELLDSVLGRHVLHDVFQQVAVGLELLIEFLFLLVVDRVP